EPPNVAEAMDALQGISQNTRRASEVIERIRALLKGQRPSYVKFDLNDAIREVIAISQSALRARGVSIRADLSTALPAAHGDRVQLQQVIMNLIMNGADAMTLITDRSPMLQVQSRIEAPGRVLVEVDDTGTGLEAGLSDRIFEPLFTTKSHGMGMGLAICKSIVESHGGRIWALPRQPHGATFQFTIPTAKDVLEDSREPAKSLPSAPAARDHR